MLGRHNCLCDRLEAVSNVFRPHDHQVHGVAFVQTGTFRSHGRGPEIRSCGTCFARLVGKFTQSGRGRYCRPEILPDAKQTGGSGSRAVFRSLHVPAVAHDERLPGQCQ